MTKLLRASTMLVNGADARTLAKRTVAREQGAVLRVARADRERFAAEMRRRAREPHVVLGATADGVPFIITLAQLDLFRAAVSGMPGSGKSIAAIIWLAWVATRALLHEDCAGVGVSIKPDIVDAVSRLLALMLQGLPRAERRRLLRRVQILKPFERVRAWALLEPLPGIPLETHASVVVEALLSVKNGMRLGEVQTPVLHALIILAISLRWTLLDLLLALLDPTSIVRAAERCPHAETRLLLTTRFPRLSRSVIDGIASRLRSLLATIAMRAMFAHVGPSFAPRQACEPGSVTLVSTGGADLGSAAASEAVNGIVLASLGFAIADPARRADAPTLLVVDEAHLPAALPTAGAAIQDAFSLGRSRKIAPVVICQAESQFDVRMREVLDATVSTRLLFAGSSNDMANARSLVAPTGAVPKPNKIGERPRAELELRTEAEESAALSRRLVEMKPREALVYERHAAFRGQFIRTRDLYIPRRDELDPEVLAELDECAGIPVSEATTLVRAKEEAAIERLGLGRAVGGVAPAADIAPAIDLHRVRPGRDRGPAGGDL
jgi:hypothetical protein